MAYAKTIWVNDETVIDAQSLNKIENQLQLLDKGVTDSKGESNKTNERIAKEIKDREASIKLVEAEIGALSIRTTTLEEYDVSIAKRLDEEIDIRQLEDGKLFAKIDTETKTRVSEDAVLFKEIEKEQTERKQKDSEIRNLIQGNKDILSALSDELSSFKTNTLNSLSQLQTEIEELSSELSAEKLNIENVDSKFTLAIQDLTSRVDTLTQYGASQSQVDEIAARLTSVEEILSNMNPQSK